MKTIQITQLLILQLFISVNMFAVNLSNEEKQGIQLMREEEKLAHDVYAFLSDKWELPIFSNISQAETLHFNAVGFLIESFELEDMAQKEAGQFENMDLQNLYDSLTAKGSESLIAALEVGAFIEELDIHDLQQLVNSTTNEILQNTYQNLLRASGNHLRAFTSQLAIRNNNYSPVVLTKTAYQTILETSPQMGRGNGNCVNPQNSCPNNQSQGKGNMRGWRGKRN